MAQASKRKRKLKIAKYRKYGEDFCKKCNKKLTKRDIHHGYCNICKKSFNKKIE